MNCNTIPELKEFLLLQEQALGSQSPEVATTVSKLADMYLDKGLLDDAEALYRRALTIREKAIPFRREVEESRRSLNKVLALKSGDVERLNRNVGVVDSFGRTSPGDTASPNGAGAWWSTQSTAGRTSAVEGAVARRTRPSDRSSPSVDTSTALDSVPPSMMLTQDPLALAESINETRLESDLIRQVSGSEDPALADCLTKLADLYCRCKRYQDMEPLLTEALQIREARYGPNHGSVATSLKNLARLYYFEGKYHRAQPLFERALLIRKRVYGNKHKKVADILEQYSKLLRKTGLTADADSMLNEAHEIRSETATWNEF